MNADLSELEHMRDLGIRYVIDTVGSAGVDEGTRLMRSFAYGMASSLAILNGERATSEFLYLMADHFAVHGLSPSDFHDIGELIKQSARNEKRRRGVA